MFCSKCGCQNTKEARFCYNCGEKIQFAELENQSQKMELQNENQMNESNSGNDLLMYLWDVAVIEQRKAMFLHMLQKEKGRLNNYKNELESKEKEDFSEKPPKEENLIPLFLGFIFLFTIGIGALALVCSLFGAFGFNFLWITDLLDVYYDTMTKRAELEKQPFIAFFLFSMLLACVPSLLIVIWMGVCQRDKLNEYQERYDQWDETKKRVITDLRNEILNQDGKIRTILKPLDETDALLQKYYSLNVLYSKYRNIDCVLRIIECLQSRRCTQLTGADGAYNTLELEMRLDKIIETLDKISSKIEMLSRQFMSISTQLDKMSSSILENLSQQNETCRMLLEKQQEVLPALDKISAISEVQLAQEKRFFDYQNFKTRQERLEEGRIFY